MSIKTILLREFNNKKYIQRIANTPEFKQWFKKSKVINDDGLPEVVFHGTESDFTEFDKGDIGFHFGTDEAARQRLFRGNISRDSSHVRDLGDFPWSELEDEDQINAIQYEIKNGEFDSKLTSDEREVLADFFSGALEQFWEYMDIYGDNIDQNLEKVWKAIMATNGFHMIYDYFNVSLSGSGERTGAYFLSIQNPLNPHDVGDWNKFDEVIEAIGLALEDDGFIDDGGEFIDKWDEIYLNVKIDDLKEKLKQELNDKFKIDGIIYKNDFEDKGSTSYIAFEPIQIKSVFNDGSFDTNDKNFMS